MEEIEPRNGVRYSRQSGACIQTAMERLQALWFMRGRRKAAYSATTICHYAIRDNILTDQHRWERCSQAMSRKDVMEKRSEA